MTRLSFYPHADLSSVADEDYLREILLGTLDSGLGVKQADGGPLFTEPAIVAGKTALFGHAKRSEDQLVGVYSRGIAQISASSSAQPPILKPDMSVISGVISTSIGIGLAALQSEYRSYNANEINSKATGGQVGPNPSLLASMAGPTAELVNEPGANPEIPVGSGELPHAAPTDFGRVRVEANNADGGVDEINSFAREPNSVILDLVQRASEEIKENYVTIVRQIAEYVRYAEGQAGPVLELLGLSDALTTVLLGLPEGPRTPSARNDNFGLVLNGDSNTMKFERYEEFTLMASLSERGDPSEPNPDSNDLPGRIEIEILGLDVGANFQNGVYVGDYRPETSETEGHHQFQTGMVDQSGAYFADSRVDFLNVIALNPESEDANALLGDLPDALSIETLGEALGNQSNAADTVAPDEGDATDTSTPEAISLFESLGLNPDYLGDLIDEAAATDFSMPGDLDVLQISPLSGSSDMLPVLEVAGLFEDMASSLNIEALESVGAITSTPSPLTDGLTSLLNGSGSV